METTYHDLSLSKLNYSGFFSHFNDGIKTANNQEVANGFWAKTEPFTEAFDYSNDMAGTMSMSTDISDTNLDKAKDSNDKVSDPYGYGYLPSIQETRNQDVNEIQMQENTIFALGAIAGVSVIVGGLLFMSPNETS